MKGKKITMESEEELNFKIALPLDLKEKLSRERVIDFYKHVGG